jgi:hypothetical protein
MLIKISADTIQETKEVVKNHSIKELEDRKIRLQIQKAQMISEFDKEIAEIDLILKAK